MSHLSNVDTAAETFNRFVAAINSHDLAALAELMNSAHLFVDSLGNRVEGSTRMQGGWRGYFTMCPDYWIRIQKLLSDGDTVLAVGAAGGTIDSIPWRTPAAWKAQVKDGSVTEWQIFADNKPVYEILAKRKP